MVWKVMKAIRMYSLPIWVENVNTDDCWLDKGFDLHSLIPMHLERGFVIARALVFMYVVGKKYAQLKFYSCGGE